MELNPAYPHSSSSHAQVLLVTETDNVMGDFLWSADPAVSTGFDDHQAKCNSENDERYQLDATIMIYHHK